jgi:hypothetical protein
VHIPSGQPDFLCTTHPKSLIPLQPVEFAGPAHLACRKKIQCARRTRATFLLSDSKNCLHLQTHQPPPRLLPTRFCPTTRCIRLFIATITLKSSVFLYSALSRILVLEFSCVSKTMGATALINGVNGLSIATDIQFGESVTQYASSNGFSNTPSSVRSDSPSQMSSSTVGNSPPDPQPVYTSPPLSRPFVSPSNFLSHRRLMQFCR